MFDLFLSLQFFAIFITRLPQQLPHCYTRKNNLITVDITHRSRDEMEKTQHVSAPRSCKIVSLHFSLLSTQCLLSVFLSSSRCVFSCKQNGVTHRFVVTNPDYVDFPRVRECVEFWEFLFSWHEIYIWRQNFENFSLPNNKFSLFRVAPLSLAFIRT